MMATTYEGGVWPKTFRKSVSHKPIDRMGVGRDSFRRPRGVVKIGLERLP